MNDIRIARAQIALDLYDQVDEGVCSLIDLLTDLHHWCHKHDVDMQDVMMTAHMHFLEESQ